MQWDATALPVHGPQEITGQAGCLEGQQSKDDPVRRHAPAIERSRVSSRDRRGDRQCPSPSLAMTYLLCSGNPRSHPRLGSIAQRPLVATMRSSAVRSLLVRRGPHHRPLRIPVATVPPLLVRRFGVDLAPGSSVRRAELPGPSISEPPHPSASDSVSAAPALESVPPSTLPSNLDGYIGSSQLPYVPPSPPPPPPEASTSTAPSKQSQSSTATQESPAEAPASSSRELIAIAQPHDFGPYAHPFDSLIFHARLKEAGIKARQADGLTQAFADIARWEYSLSRIKLFSKTMMEHVCRRSSICIVC